MPAKRQPKKSRGEYSEAVVHADIQGKIAPGCPLDYYLSQIRGEDVDGATEYQRGLAEGMRRLARQLQDIAAGNIKEGE